MVKRVPGPSSAAKPKAGGGKASAGKVQASKPLVDSRFDTSAFSSDDDGEQQQPLGTFALNPRARTQPAVNATGADEQASGSSSEEDRAAAEESGKDDEDEDLLADLEEPSSGLEDEAGNARDTAEPGSRSLPDGEPAAVAAEDATKRKRKVLSAEKVARMTATADRRGIVYMSRIPPHMKPHKLRQLLSEHGELGRVYCAPEDPSLRRMRKQKGGNTGKNFTEGWVEFDDKRRAKRAALQLNGQPMGGRHRSAYRYDLWNLKYLPRFKWDHLTEEVSYQRAVREQKLAVEISAAKRERDFYLSRVDRAKGMAAQQERRTARAAAGPSGDGAGAAAGPASSSAPAGTRGGAAGGSGGGAGKGGEARPERKERHYGQRKLKIDPTGADAPDMPGDILALLRGRKRAKA